MNSQKSSAYRPQRNKLPITLQYLGICMTSDVLKQFSVLQPWGYTLKGYILKSCITNGKMLGNKAWGSTNIYPNLTLLDSYQDAMYPCYYDNPDLDYIEIKQD